jgi:hypothetical protein
MRIRLLIAVASVASAMVFGAPGAFGAQTTKTLNFPLSGTNTTSIFDLGPYTCCDIGTINIFGDTIGGNISAELLLDMQTTLNAPTHSDLTFTDTNLRQGRTLDLTNTYSRDAGGSLGVTYNLAFHLDAYGFHFDPTKSEGDTLACSVPLLTEPDGTFPCQHKDEIGLFDFTLLDVGLGSINVHFSLPVTTTADLTSGGVTSNRSMTAAGNQILGPSPLTFTSDPFVQNENAFLSCSLPANEPVNYAMDQATSTAGGSVQESIGLGVSIVASPIVGPDFTVAGPFDIIPAIDLPAKTINPISVSAPAQNVDLGNLLPNNIAPSAAMDTIPSDGTEGSPIKLGIIGTGPGGSISPCGDNNLDIHWSFDDGGSAYGKTVYHAWADNFLGDPSPPHSGQVVITDPTGLQTTLNFSVPVANVPPTVKAPPDKTAYWGVPVSFHGNGSDTGPTDNASLLYAWDFGDPNSPVGATGQDATHTYSAPSAPGTPYQAKVTVTDNDGATGSDTVNVTVIKRDSSLAYMGDTSFTVTDGGTLRAALGDGLTSGAVPGRTVDFYVDGTKVGSGVTDNSGNVSVAYTPPLGSVGAHCVQAKFAGDAKYNASASTGGCAAGTAISVAKNQSGLAYTGPLTSSPSKSVTLTAKLTDDLARALVGKSISFSLGSQSCSGTTDATGNVSCTIAKLNQNPGNYLFVVNFAGDANYAFGSVNTTFTIGK